MWQIEVTQSIFILVPLRCNYLSLVKIQEEFSSEFLQQNINTIHWHKAISVFLLYWFYWCIIYLCSSPHHNNLLRIDVTSSKLQFSMVSFILFKRLWSYRFIQFVMSDPWGSVFTTPNLSYFYSGVLPPQVESLVQFWKERAL